MATVKPTKSGNEYNYLGNIKVVRWLGILLGELAVLALIFAVVIVPRFEETFKLWEEQKKQQELIRNLQTKSEELERFKVDFAPRLSLLDEAVPRSKDVGLMLSALRQLADGAGAAIAGYKLNPGAVKTETGPAAATNYLEMELTVTGNEAAVQKFLRGVDSSVPVKLVKNLEVTSRTIQGDSGTTQLPEMKMLLWIYYLEDTTKAEATALLKELSDADLETLNGLSRYERVKKAGDTVSVDVVRGSGDLFGLEKIQ